MYTKLPVDREGGTLLVSHAPANGSRQSSTAKLRPGKHTHILFPRAGILCIIFPQHVSVSISHHQPGLRGSCIMGLSPLPPQKAFPALVLVLGRLLSRSMVITAVAVLAAGSVGVVVVGFRLDLRILITACMGNAGGKHSIIRRRCRPLCAQLVKSLVVFVRAEAAYGPELAGELVRRGRSVSDAGGRLMGMLGPGRWRNTTGSKIARACSCLTFPASREHRRHDDQGRDRCIWHPGTRVDACCWLNPHHSMPCHPACPTA